MRGESKQLGLLIFFKKAQKRREQIIKELQINEQIRENEIRVIGVEGEQLGLMPTSKARALAEEEGLDLAKISVNNGVAICKIMDYGKYKFDQSKKEKENKKNQKITQIKEIQLSMRIEKHDWEFKQKHALEFLGDGDKVKVVVRMRGREQAFADKAIETANKFFEDIKEYCTIDKPVEKLGRNVVVVLTPIKK